MAELKDKLNKTVNEMENNQTKTREALVQMDQARKLKLSIAGKVKNLIFVQNELEHEKKVKQQKITGLVKQIEKIEPIFGTLQRIDQKCKEEGISGYKGLFIDFLKCSSDNFMPCVDIAGKSKLFSVVVDTLETAKEVLRINSQIKGGIINIFPLETMEQMSKPLK